MHKEGSFPWRTIRQYHTVSKAAAWVAPHCRKGKEIRIFWENRQAAEEVRQEQAPSWESEPASSREGGGLLQAAQWNHSRNPEILLWSRNLLRLHRTSPVTHNWPILEQHSLPRNSRPGDRVPLIFHCKSMLSSLQAKLPISLCSFHPFNRCWLRGEQRKCNACVSGKLPGVTSPEIQPLLSDHQLDRQQHKECSNSSLPGANF